MESFTEDEILDFFHRIFNQINLLFSFDSSINISLRKFMEFANSF